MGRRETWEEKETAVLLKEGDLIDRVLATRDGLPEVRFFNVHRDCGELKIVRIVNSGFGWRCEIHQVNSEPIRRR